MPDFVRCLKSGILQLPRILLEALAQAPLPLIGTSAATGQQVLNPLLPSRLQGLRRRLIAQEISRRRRPLPATRQTQHHEAPGHDALPCLDHLPGAYRRRGLGLAPIHAHPPQATGLGRQRAGFVGAHRPQPLVEPRILRGGSLRRRAGFGSASLRAFHAGRLRPRPGRGKRFSQPPPMFAPFFRFTTRTPDPEEFEHPFVRELRVEHPREPRSRRLEFALIVGWALVIAKCAAVWWLCRTYAVPFNAWWLIGPTLAFATLCTLLYWRRD